MMQRYIKYSMNNSKDLFCCQQGEPEAVTVGHAVTEECRMNAFTVRQESWRLPDFTAR